LATALGARYDADYGPPVPPHLLAQGDVARFSALLAEYVKAPVVTRRRIYIETLQDVMPSIRSKIIVDEQTRSILPLLNLDSQKGERP
jgi:membrane protease subunit HflK